MNQPRRNPDPGGRDTKWKKYQDFREIVKQCADQYPIKEGDKVFTWQNNAIRPGILVRKVFFRMPDTTDPNTLLITLGEKSKDFSWKIKFLSAKYQLQHTRNYPRLIVSAACPLIEPSKHNLMRILEIKLHAEERDVEAARVREGLRRMQE